MKDAKKPKRGTLKPVLIRFPEDVHRATKRRARKLRAKSFSKYVVKLCRDDASGEGLA
jgi:hypothetical protein